MTVLAFNRNKKNIYIFGEKEKKISNVYSISMSFSVQSQIKTL